MGNRAENLPGLLGTSLLVGRQGVETGVACQRLNRRDRRSAPEGQHPVTNDANTMHTVVTQHITSVQT